jgi:glycosyltransferase involved in cell wall biosynthesis
VLAGFIVRSGPSGLKVLFDAHWWTDGPPSGRRVMRNLVEAWLHSFPHDQVMVSTYGEAAAKEIGSTFDTVTIHKRKIAQHGLSNLVELGLAGRFSDCIIAFNYTPLFGRRNASVMIFDLMFAEHPEWFTRSERAYFSVMAPAARRANHVLTISFSERDRIKRFAPKLDSVTNVGLALPREFRDAPEESPQTALPSSFLLAVGRLNVRKNLVLAAQSLRAANVISVDRPLVVVGTSDGAGPGFDAVREAIREGTIRLVGDASDSELKWLYSNCDVFVFPSLDEGFGLPVLEAKSCGARVALSDIPAFREFGDTVGTFFNPLSSASIVAAVQRALSLDAGSSKWVTPRDLNWSVVVRNIRDTIVAGK